MCEQAEKIIPTLSITGKYDQIVPPYTQELANLIPTVERAEILK